MKDRIKEILQKGKSAQKSSKEEHDMFSLFHQPDSEFEIKDALLSEIESFETNQNIRPDYESMFNKTWKKIKSTKDNELYIRLYSFLRVAAILVIGLILGVILNFQSDNKEIEYYSAHSPRGSVVDLKLPDGSVIYLNSGSNIKYASNFEKKQREVFLKGEAWFHVTNKNNNPFIIHTPYYDIKVTGTRFNVKAYENDDLVSTTLEEGQVIISPGKKDALSKEIALKPNEQLTYNKTTRKIIIKKVDAKLYTAWREDKLVFVNHVLDDLFRVLERKYDVNIIVKDKELLDLHFDGIFKDESLEDILEILKKAVSIDYNISGNRVEITKDNN